MATILAANHNIAPGVVLCKENGQWSSGILVDALDDPGYCMSEFLEMSDC